jgi:hypothetical protein
METDVLELKFEGNNINPSIVRPSEIASLIDNFEKALLQTIAITNPEIKTDAVLFSFNEIDDKSLDIRFFTRIATDAVLTAYLLITTSVSNNDYSKLSSGTIKALKAITKFSKKYECNGYFNHNNETVATFSSNTEIGIEKSNFIKGETTIYGQIIDIGGEDPNVHFKINNNYVVIIDVTQELAESLAHKLYKEIGLKGIAKWDANSFEVEEFKISDIIDYEPTNIKSTFQEIRNIIGKYWDEIEDVNAFLH